MEQIAVVIIMVALYVVLFHDDYNWAEKIKQWFLKKAFKQRS